MTGPRATDRGAAGQGGQPGSSPPAARPDRGSLPAWGQALALLALALLVYLPVWRAGFVWDDDSFLVENPLIHRADGLWRFWFSTDPPDYFPMTSTVLWAEWRLWGTAALEYHLVNVLLHGLNAILAWRILLRLRLPGAWLAAALFAVHPVNVESVAWITERKNTLAMGFYAGALLSYLRFEDTARRRWFALALGAFALALLSKTAVVPLPFVLIGLAWWRRGKVGRQDLLRTVPFFALALAMGLVTIWFQAHRAIGSVVVREDGFWPRLAGAGWAVWFYLGKAVAPLHLCFVYPRWQIEPGNPLSYLPAALAALVLWICWRRRQVWGTPCLFAFGYFVLMLLPVLGFVNIYFMRYSLVADHWQYFALLAPLALGAGAFRTFFARLAPRWRAVERMAAGLVVVLLGILTLRQSQAYENGETLWRATLAGNPRSVLALNNYGSILVAKGRVEEAKALFQKALEVEPRCAETCYNLGLAEAKLGQIDPAIAWYLKAVEYQPGNAVFHNNLANSLLQKGQVDQAIAEYHKALEIQPNHADALNNLGSALVRKGLVEDGIVCYQRALAVNPDLMEARYNLGQAWLQTGRVSDAVGEWWQVVRRQPRNAVARNDLAWVLATSPDDSLRDSPSALRLAEEANQIAEGQNATILRTLAAAYASAGRFEEAVAAARRAGQFNTAPSGAFAANLQAEIKLYSAHTPFRDSGLGPGSK